MQATTSSSPIASGLITERGFASVRTQLIQEEQQGKQLDFNPLVEELRANFNTKKSFAYEFRLHQLNQLRRGCYERRGDIMQAVMKDLGRHKAEAFQGEIATSIGDIDYAIENLKEWMKPEPGTVGLLVKPATQYLVRQPKGVTLIISPFNYPFCLAIQPLQCAISAGCACVIKPSEMTPNTAKMIEEIVHQYLDRKFYRVVTPQ